MRALTDLRAPALVRSVTGMSDVVPSLEGAELLGWSARRTVHRLADGAHLVLYVRFSPDGATLAVSHHGCWELGLDLLDVKTRTKRTSLKVSHSDSVVFSRDGKLLAFQGEKQHLELWDVEQGRSKSLSPQPFPKRAFALAFSPNGRSLAVAGDGGAILLLDLSTFTPRSK